MAWIASGRHITAGQVVTLLDTATKNGRGASVTKGSPTSVFKVITYAHTAFEPPAAGDGGGPRVTTFA